MTKIILVLVVSLVSLNAFSQNLKMEHADMKKSMMETLKKNPELKGKMMRKMMDDEGIRNKIHMMMMNDESMKNMVKENKEGKHAMGSKEGMMDMMNDHPKMKEKMMNMMMGNPEMMKKMHTMMLQTSEKKGDMKNKRDYKTNHKH